MHKRRPVERRGTWRNAKAVVETRIAASSGPCRRRRQKRSSKGFPRGSPVSTFLSTPDNGGRSELEAKGPRKRSTTQGQRGGEDVCRKGGSG